MPIPDAKSIAVLGAGITGLTAAYRLSKTGHRVRIFEQQSRPGGAVGSDYIDGWLCERGPNSMLANDPATSDLIEELGLTHECVTANPLARKRYLVKHGKPLAAPGSPPAFLTSPLFSLGTKLRLLGEFLRRPQQRPGDISLARLIEDHFGRETVDSALNPFVGGVYAGDPDQLSARYAFPKLWECEQQYGSIIRGMMVSMKNRPKSKHPRKGIVSFRQGLQTLTDSLAQHLPAGSLVLNAQIETIFRGNNWRVFWRSEGQEQHEEFDLVVSALPAAGLARLKIGSSGDCPLGSLSEVPHPPVDSLVLGYRREQIAHPLDGFGMLVPEKEGRSILGVLFTSSLFPGRAPEGHASLTVMIGGTRQPELTGLETGDLLRRIQPDLQDLLGVQGNPVFQRHQSWPRAISQYNLGHGEYLEAISLCEQQNPGLYIGGQIRDGIALPACISAGEKLAARATES